MEPETTNPEEETMSPATETPETGAPMTEEQEAAPEAPSQA